MELEAIEPLGAPLVDDDLWARIEGVLNMPYGRVEFLAGGHRYTVTTGRVSAGKVAYAPMVRVDGEINSDWISNCPEHVRKFWRCQKRYHQPKKIRDMYARATRREKKVIEKLHGDINSQFELWSPIWSGPKTLIRQIKSIPDLRVYEIKGIML